MCEYRYIEIEKKVVVMQDNNDGWSFFEASTDNSIILDDNVNRKDGYNTSVCKTRLNVGDKQTKLACKCL